MTGSDLDQKFILTNRPVEVTIAVFIMWGYLGVSIVLALGNGLLSFGSIITWVTLTIIIYSLSQGMSWALYTYFIIIFLSHIFVITMAIDYLDSWYLLSILPPVVLMFLLFNQKSTQWFAAVGSGGPRLSLFTPSYTLKLSVINLFIFWCLFVLHSISKTFLGVEISSFLIGICVLVSFVFYCFAKWSHRLEQDRIQSERNSHAHEFVELLSESRGKMQTESVLPYVLYLRSFTTTGNLPTPFAKGDLTILDRYIYGFTFDFESFLGKALREEGSPTWEVYSIGDLKGGIGSDKIIARDEDWRKVFALLAEKADAIVICPFDTPGTQWEIDKLILSPQLLSKTIFVLPPIHHSLWKNYDFLASAWERTKKRLCDKIPMFPSHLDDYMIFLVRPMDCSVVELNKGPLSISKFKSIVMETHENSTYSPVITEKNV